MLKRRAVIEPLLAFAIEHGTDAQSPASEQEWVAYKALGIFRMLWSVQRKPITTVDGPGLRR